jgi:phospholipid/cholesterol/gamma-HCH transport system ATP-binding protein
MRVELQQVTVERTGQIILDGVDLDLAPGRMSVVLGRSGAGLSTLLKTAAGLLAPADGCVLYDGCDIAMLDARKRRSLQARTGFMFQDAALWANQDLASNFDLPLRVKYPAQSARQRRERIASVLQACGWSISLDRRPVDLSLGEQKMASFLRAVIPGPEVLFLDEPMASLDGHWREILIRRLQEMRSREVTIAAVSQDPSLVADLADEIVILSRGSVLAQAAPAEIARSSDPEIRSIMSQRRVTVRAGRDEGAAS